MATCYTCADNEVSDRIARLMKAHHAPLVNEEVDVRALMASSGDPDKPAVKLHGYRCFAIVGAVGLKERVQGLGDAVIIIDAEAYGKMEPRIRDALLDHELTHIELVRNKKTAVVERDEHGRPKLKMKLHDWELGGFASIAERYGGSAIEVRQIQVASDTFGQTFWAWEGAPKWRRSKGGGIAGSVPRESLDIKRRKAAAR